MIHDLGPKDRCQYSRSLLPWFRGPGGQGCLARGHPSPVRVGAPCGLLLPAESPPAALRAGSRCVRASGLVGFVSVDLGLLLLALGLVVG
jgi:hypothetical protein